MASSRSPWVWVLAPMLAAVAVVGVYALMPVSSIERPDQRGTLVIECLGCPENASVQITGVEETRVALPGRVRLRPGRYVLDIDVESVPLSLFVGPGDVVSAQYDWVKRIWR